MWLIYIRAIFQFNGNLRTKIIILKWLDRLIGKPILILLSRMQDSQPATCDLQPAAYERFLIIRPGGIGDATLLFPALYELRKSFPHSQIDVLAEKRNRGILELCPYIDRLYLYDRGLDIFRVLRNRYDTVIDTEQWHRLSAVIAFLTGAEVRIGFSTNERERLFTHKVEYSHYDYEANSFLNLFNVLLNPNVEFNPEKRFISIPASGPEPQVPVPDLTVALFLEVSVKEREWEADKFFVLGDRLIQRGMKVIVMGKRRIPELKNRKIINFTGRDLTDTIIQLSKVQLLVSGDTGIMHIAYGLGIPTVSLFGADIEDKWAPKGKNHIIINKKLPCSPCTKFGYTPACPMDVKCMRLITADEVEEAVLKLLSIK